MVVVLIFQFPTTFPFTMIICIDLFIFVFINKLSVFFYSIEMLSGKKIRDLLFYLQNEIKNQ